MKECWLTMSPVSSITQEKKARNESMHTSSESPRHRHLAQYQMGLPTFIVAGSLWRETCHKYQPAFSGTIYRRWVRQQESVHERGEQGTHLVGRSAKNKVKGNPA